MKHILKKLKSSSGETLVELLASILIAVLSVSILFGGIMVSVRINEEADRADQEYYKGLSAAEEQKVLILPDGAEGTDEISVNINNDAAITAEPVKVNIYGGYGLYSYKRPAEAGGGAGGGGG